MQRERLEGPEALQGERGPHPVTTLLVIMLAGSVGVGLRYLLDALVTANASDTFPWSTLIINIAGALAIGIIAGAMSGTAGEPLVYPAVTIGLLGGFTTFSSLALDSISLAEQGMLLRSFVYVGATNVLGIAACAIGLFGARALS